MFIKHHKTAKTKVFESYNPGHFKCEFDWSDDENWIRITYMAYGNIPLVYSVVL